MGMLKIVENSISQSFSVEEECIKELRFIYWVRFKTHQNLLDILGT